MICMCTGIDRPTLRLLNSHVRNKVASKWYYLGEELLAYDQSEKLNVIKQDHTGDTKMCCTKMFKTWLDVDTEASWNKLIVALEQIDKHALAENIRRNILKGSDHSLAKYIHMYASIIVVRYIIN